MPLFLETPKCFFEDAGTGETMDYLVWHRKMVWLLIRVYGYDSITISSDLYPGGSMCMVICIATFTININQM